MPRRLSLSLFTGLLAVTVTALGCGSGKPKEQTRAQVSGTVTLDKQPLKTGNILFDPNDGTPPTTLDILDGKYEGRAPVGKNTVRINSFVKVTLKEKMKMSGPGYDTPTDENMLPPRYNAKSEINREVVAERARTCSTSSWRRSRVWRRCCAPPGFPGLKAWAGEGGPTGLENLGRPSV